MPAKDIFHETVKKALLKEGWTITADPLYIQVGGVDLYVDLAAERVLAAEKNGRKIAVEIKSFVSPSLISEFHTALGQFVNYRIALQFEEPYRVLYLAVSIDTYDAFFTLPFIQSVITNQKIKLIIYNVDQEVIIEWHE